MISAKEQTTPRGLQQEGISDPGKITAGQEPTHFHKQTHRGIWWLLFAAMLGDVTRDMGCLMTVSIYDAPVVIWQEEFLSKMLRLLLHSDAFLKGSSGYEWMHSCVSVNLLRVAAHLGLWAAGGGPALGGLSVVEKEIILHTGQVWTCG